MLRFEIIGNLHDRSELFMCTVGYVLNNVLLKCAMLD